MTVPPFVIAIDGPAGAGKSAAARELARRLQVPYLDTGAMYRAVALAAWRRGIRAPLGEGDEAAVAALAERARIEFRPGGETSRVILDGEDVTERLRTPEISNLASVVSTITGVRRALVARQRELATATGGVVEGRDIGTVVFPDAPVKVFLTAAPEVRARRRFEELRRRGVAVDWESIVEEQRQRDLRDASRAASPLRPAPDAVIVDTSGLTLGEVVERLVAIVQRVVSGAQVVART